MQRSMAGQDWAMLVGLALVFGSAFFLVKLALGSYGPLTVALIRVVLGCLILTAVAVWRGRALPRGLRIWLTLLVMGALNNAIPFALICWGQTHIESGLTAILNAMTPIFTVLAAHAAGQERLTLRRLAGVALGFLGVAVLIGPESLRHLDPTNHGGDRGAAGGGLLCRCRHLGPAAARASHRGRRGRHARRQHAASAASGAAARASLAHLADTGEPRRAGGAGRPQHGGGLSALFPPAAPGGADQSAAGHLPAADRGLGAWARSSWGSISRSAISPGSR